MRVRIIVRTNPRGRIGQGDSSPAAVAPPPAAPGRPPAYEPPSTLERLWNALKPPPAVPRETEPLPEEDKNRRRKLLFGTAAIIGAGAVAWGGYLHVASAPARAEAVFQEGMLRMGAGDYNGAVERFTKAVNIWPRMALGFFERGVAHTDLNQPDAAIEDFERAIGQDSSLAAAHTALGKIYRQRGDLTRATGEFTASLQLNANMEAFYDRGQARESLGQYQQAMEDYDAAIHEAPDAPYIYRARATSREALGDHDGAEEDRQTAVRLEQ